MDNPNPLDLSSESEDYEKKAELVTRLLDQLKGLEPQEVFSVNLKGTNVTLQVDDKKYDYQFDEATNVTIKVIKH